KGAAHFPGISSDLRGQDVSISVVAEGYERAGPEMQKLTSESLYLPIRKSPGRLHGAVMDERGLPLPAATVRVGGLERRTDSAGRFDLAIPGDQLQPDMSLDVQAPGFRPQTYTVNAGANEIRIRLERTAQ